MFYRTAELLLWLMYLGLTDLDLMDFGSTRQNLEQHAMDTSRYFDN